ncbi:MULTISPECIES: CU044_2847 family protein [unclassified Anabaena]|uniref:CU044_2847 family protein n=1 Tax=unclassified Anabaena TaxID=2619674 RepID=UPI00082D7907|nr:MULTISPECIES: CU044_2847 family protein [unclassified Anabaena]
MEIQTRIISLELADGTSIKVEATPIGERKGIIQSQDFCQITTAIESITKDIAQALQKVKPDKANVKFGIGIAIESGKLIPLIVKDGSTANFEITLEWVNH